MKVLYRFAKKDRLRFVSHLDLQRFMQRALNRTDMKIAYSQGFNPHPLISFASALAMGWTSDYEVLDVRLAEESGLDFCISEMSRALPPDLPIISAKLTDDRHPAPMGQVEAAEYVVTFPDVVDAEAPVMSFLELASATAIRKTKSGEREIDVKPLTLSLSADKNRLFCRVMLTERDTLKPDLLAQTVFRCAGLDAPDMRVHRLTLLGRDAKGELAPIMEL